VGKKKASQSRKLRPILEEHIREGRVYFRNFESSRSANSGILTDGIQKFEVIFGGDSQWFNAFVIPLVVHINNQGDIDFYFIQSRAHMLSRTDEIWFETVLKEMITMHKLGAYESQHDADGPTLDNIQAYTKNRWTKKKKRRE